MGRYYKAPDANFVKPEDFLYKAPWEEIKAGLKYQDEQIDTILDSAQAGATAFSNIKYNFNDPTERALFNKKYQDYVGQMNDISSKILANPMAWRNYSGTMRTLGNTLKEDMLKGDLFYMQKREEARKEFEATNKGKMDPVWYNTLLKNRMDKVQSELLSGNASATFDNSAVFDRKNIQEDFLKFAKEMKPNIVSVNSAGERGMFFQQKNGTITEISEAEIQNLFNQYVNSSEMKGYLKFAQDEGLMQNVFDPETGSARLDGDLAPIQDFVTNIGAYREEKISMTTDYSLSAKVAADIAKQEAAHRLAERSAINAEKRAAVRAAQNPGPTPDRPLGNTGSYQPSIHESKGLLSTYILDASKILNTSAKTPEQRKAGSKLLVASIAKALGMSVKDYNALPREEKAKRFANTTPEQQRAFVQSMYSTAVTNKQNYGFLMYNDSGLHLPNLIAKQEYNYNTFRKGGNRNISLASEFAQDLTGFSAKQLDDESKRIQDQELSGYVQALGKKPRIYSKTSSDTGNNANLRYGGVRVDISAGQNKFLKAVEGDTTGVTTYSSSDPSKNRIDFKTGRITGNTRAAFGSRDVAQYVVEGVYNGEPVYFVFDNDPRTGVEISGW